MYLTRLVYTSTVTSTFNQDSVEQILLKAREHNKLNNITGMLCFSSSFFLQCLEGSRSAVNKTYHKILNDNRHSRIVLLEYDEIYQREFDDWSMGYIPESALTESANLKHSGNKLFSPYEMSGKSAHAMLLSLKDAVPTL